jgi:hypothetical protein
VQLRRVLLLFALVLGLSALVASLAPPPERPGEGDKEAAPPESTGVTEPAAAASRTVRFSAPGPAVRPRAARVVLGSQLTVEVRVPRPGEVELEGLGLRASADRLTPARFDLTAQPAGRYAVVFHPARGGERVAGRLEFAEKPRLRQPRRRR